MMEFAMSCNWSTIRVWLLGVILVALLAGAPALAQGPTAVRVEPSLLTVQVNDTVNISVKVDNIANLSAFELHLSFNPGVLEVTGITNGGFVAADFVAQNTFDNAAGTIDYAVAQMNRPPAQGNGTLLNISFRAKADGSSTLTRGRRPVDPSFRSEWNGDPGFLGAWHDHVQPPQSSTNTPTHCYTYQYQYWTRSYHEHADLHRYTYQYQYWTRSYHEHANLHCYSHQNSNRDSSSRYVGHTRRALGGVALLYWTRVRCFTVVNCQGESLVVAQYHFPKSKTDHSECPMDKYDSRTRM
jgi:hypothetical protein